MNEFKWYVLKVVSGQEKKVRDSINLDFKVGKWADYIDQVVFPCEKVYKLQKGKKVLVDRSFLPGYLLFHGDLSDGDMVLAIKSVPGVLGFLSGRGWSMSSNPVPLRQADVDSIFNKIDGIKEVGNVSLDKDFTVGESVKVIDGPFNSFIGDIQEVFEDRKKIIVMVKIFGRNTPVELSYFQVEKSK